MPESSERSRKILDIVALFLGELRDGLTMINMQSAFLISSKGYSEKQVGILFFVFGMSQFLFQAPAGYLMDYTDRKISWLGVAAVLTTLFTVITATTAEDEGGNIGFMILIKFLQGGITAMIPPGLNSITQGIVGSVGMTSQVSMNEMMNHLGTSILVLTGSLIAYAKYPDIGVLFIVSPIACAGVIFFLNRIHPEDIDHNAARGLVLEASPDNPEILPPSSGNYAAPEIRVPGKKGVQTMPSFNFWGAKGDDSSVVTATPKADTPLQVLREPRLLLFTAICFLFHTANGCVLPLVMQSLAIGNGRSGILLSGCCIILAQLCMVASAKICGQYSVVYGRKVLFLTGLFTVPVRCLILCILVSLRDDAGSSLFLNGLILSTQILDGVGAGVFGTMYILVTSDLSGGTGRFSLTLGITTAAMSIGGTVSGYLGEALAEDLGYKSAFIILGIMACVPAILYLMFMPETLPAYTNQSTKDPHMSHGNPMDRIDEGSEETDQRQPTSTNYVGMMA
mmetsp:Transcript_10911/g.16336  ORF Transcript_10911/g.16336 Transcript_10911/m.16336 type:complete len:510 (-) Transcript_10911:134-1663(-)